MTLWQHLDKSEAEFLAALLAKHGGNASAAARDAGVSRSVFYKRLRKHNLTQPRVFGNAEWRALQ